MFILWLINMDKQYIEIDGRSSCTLLAQVIYLTETLPSRNGLEYNIQ